MGSVSYCLSQCGSYSLVLPREAGGGASWLRKLSITILTIRIRKEIQEVTEPQRISKGRRIVNVI